jgi:hypothetical protein
VERSSPLRRLQTLLSDAILHPEGVEVAVAQSPEILDLIENLPPLLPADRIQIYSNDYILRLREVLAKDFPETALALGNELFTLMTERYLNRYPSESFTLGELGRRLPKFLREELLDEEPETSSFHEKLKKAIPYIAELAEFEWKKVELFYHPETPKISGEVLSGIPAELWGGIGLTLSSAVRILELSWNVLNVPPRQEPTQVLVFRAGFTVRAAVLSRPEVRLLKAFGEGKTLGAALDDVAVDLTTAEIELLSGKLLEWMRAWIELGIITDIRRPDV